MKIIDAGAEFRAGLFKELLDEALPEWNTLANWDEKKLFWRMGPTQGYNLAKLTYDVIIPIDGKVSPDSPKKLFADTLLDIPLKIEWDFADSVVDLRYEATAIGKIINLPQPSL